jgi:hypothetical protein
MADDAARGVVVMFGGSSFATPVMGDTWEWNGASWKQRSSTGPAPRSGHSLAYDASCKRVVLFGGISGTIRRNDLWLWDGAAGNWIQSGATGPTARTGIAMAFDGSCSRLALFGGYDGQPNYDGDTWELGAAPSLDPFTLQPVGITVEAGQSVTLSVMLSSPATLQWRRNGVNLVNGGQYSGVTTNVLTISSADAAQNGIYDVVAKASCTTSSAPAAVTVQPPLGSCLYAIDFNGNTPFSSKIYQLNPGTGAPIGAPKATTPPVGPSIGLETFNNMLYAVTTAGSSPSGLYRIDPVTGVSTLIGNTEKQLVEGDLAFDGSGTLYAASNSDLYRISTMSGKATLVGTISGPTRDISGLAFDTRNPQQQILYAIDNGLIAGSSTFLLRLNPANAQIIGAPIPLATKLGAWGGLDFDSSTGLLEAADSGPAGTNKLYRIEPKSGSMQSIGATTITPGVSGLAFCHKPSCTPPPGGLVAWYSFDELGTSASDHTSFANTATRINGPFSTVGFVGGALGFAGVDGYLEAPSRPQIDFGTGNFSIDFWIAIGGQDSGTRAVLDKRIQVGHGFRGYHIAMIDGELWLQLADGTFANYESKINVSDGNWHFVTVTVDRASKSGVRWYDNAALVSIQDPTARQLTLTNTSPLRIGRRTVDSPAPFKGILDELELFNVALTPQQVIQIYTAASAGKCK